MRNNQEEKEIKTTEEIIFVCGLSGHHSCNNCDKNIQWIPLSSYRKLEEKIEEKDYEIKEKHIHQRIQYEEDKELLINEIYSLKEKIERIQQIIHNFAIESDVDGRGILFQFSDTALRELKEELKESKR